VAGAKLFRWDARQRFAAREGKGWLAVVLVAWLAVGGMAESRGEISGERRVASSGPAPRVEVVSPVAALGATAPPLRAAPALAPRSAPGEPTGVPGTRDSAPSRPAPPSRADQWERVTLADVERDIDFGVLPPDNGLVAPIASSDEALAPEVGSEVECMRMMVPGWGPARVADPVQRVRNYLYVAAVPDVYQTGDLERWAPLVVFERLQEEIPKDELIKILYWIATHPAQGDVASAGQLRGVCFDRGAPSDVALLRERTAFYAAKLLGRLTGKIAAR
jgi:hypothetical protein